MKVSQFSIQLKRQDFQKGDLDFLTLECFFCDLKAVLMFGLKLQNRKTSHCRIADQQEQ